MISLFKKKGKGAETEAPKEQTPAEKLKHLVDNFINSTSIEVSNEGISTRVSPIKWLYPGYGDYTNHAIMPDENDKKATEIINEPSFITKFLNDNRDINGFYGYFVARVEGNYMLISDNGSTMFSEFEKQADDYDLIVYAKQAKRLFPKIDTETLAVDFKHIEAFGIVFNKLKMGIKGDYYQLSPSLQKLISIDIPTYASSSVKLENSLDSYYIFKLAEQLERLLQDVNAVSEKQMKYIMKAMLERMDKVKDMLYGSENTKRFLRAIENLEKIGEQLIEIRSAYEAFCAAPKN